jgi:uncharacterized repeat protein (TIGR03803 family)
MNSLLRSAMAMAAGIVFAAGHANAAPAQNPRALYSFCSQSGCIDGSEPMGGLVRGPDGAFYGVTEYGGIGDSAYPSGAGVIYSITPSGSFSVLHQLDSSVDGAEPTSNLTLGSDGNLYGTTPFGGTHNFGTIFRISPAGAFTVLHEFAGSDGHFSLAPPVEDAQGNWYGTTAEGGLNGRGTIYEISSGGVFQVMHDFTGRLDGNAPESALLLASDGNFYGTTSKGGSRDNYGTVFRMTPSGTLTTLHVFTGVDGEFPQQALVRGPGGALYGTTDHTNSELHAGTVFRITLKGKFTSLYSFNQDGQIPTSALTLMPDGYLYGESESIDGSDGGSIYRISSNGEYTQLDVIANGSQNGFGLESALVRGPNNALYGTAVYGGGNSQGTVFRYVPPPIQ